MIMTQSEITTKVLIRMLEIYNDTVLDDWYVNDIVEKLKQIQDESIKD